jgi:hypothetical protein
MWKLNRRDPSCPGASEGRREDRGEEKGKGFNHKDHKDHKDRKERRTLIFADKR